ncbi:MAG: 2-amino-4-hydroxy-6-hydroxymethyldihydropteridine diphosphokinase [Selenomonadaceae bacterium]
MKSYKAYLSIGSNLGDRAKNLEDAIALLRCADGVAVERVSRIYETRPWGKLDQPLFLNIAAVITASVEPIALLDVCQSIEHRLGRVRHEHWGARTIDIDILMADGYEIETERLKIPHPYMIKRAFVLVPLAEIAPDVIVSGKKIAEWLKLLSDEETAGVEEYH